MNQLSTTISRNTLLCFQIENIYFMCLILQWVLSITRFFFGESLFREKRCSQTEQIFLTCGLYWPVDHCDAVGNLHLLARNSQSKYHPLCTFPTNVEKQKRKYLKIMVKTGQSRSLWFEYNDYLHIPLLDELWTLFQILRESFLPPIYLSWTLWR